MSVHACNEANKITIEMALKHGAGYAVLPCCIRDGLYTQHGLHRVDGDTRYAIMVGVMAATYPTHKISSIDVSITNKNLVCD